LNGAALNNRVEVKVEFYEDITFKQILKDACTQLKNKDKYKTAKFYNRQGLEMQDDDVEYMKGGDIYYLALNGNSP
jgi:hypothetical protein